MSLLKSAFSFIIPTVDAPVSAIVYTSSKDLSKAKVLKGPLFLDMIYLINHDKQRDVFSWCVAFTNGRRYSINTFDKLEDCCVEIQKHMDDSASRLRSESERLGPNARVLYCAFRDHDGNDYFHPKGW
ncbi:hypothetical protein HOL82_03535 [Candidatus Woesearchaeota archaeon]|jgi:hypothetical protein|nr:hypothetical protein [Candidatus Woesearchaeota archaeon]